MTHCPARLGSPPLLTCDDPDPLHDGDHRDPRTGQRWTRDGDRYIIRGAGVRP